MFEESFEVHVWGASPLLGAIIIFIRVPVQHTSYQFAIQMTPFEALYCIAPLIHISYFPKDSSVEAEVIFALYPCVLNFIL